MNNRVIMNLGGKSSSKYFRYLLVAFVPQANDDLSVYVELVKLFFQLVLVIFTACLIDYC